MEAWGFEEATSQSEISHLLDLENRIGRKSSSARYIDQRMKKNKKVGSDSGQSKASKTAERDPRIAVAIMAAGKGTRLKSRFPKVLHEVGGRPLLEHVIRAAVQLVPPTDVFAIIGHEADRVRAAVEHTGVRFVLQAEQKGTGHALMVAREALSGYDHVIVLSGDAPLISPQTISNLRDFHLGENAAMTLLSAELENPTGYGRVLRKGPKSAEVQGIVEEKSASSSQKKIREINSGFYVFNVKELFHHIADLSTENAHAEYYLTDMAAVLRRARQRVVAWKTPTPNEVLGGNTRAELADIDQKMRMAKCQQLMADGVSVHGLVQPISVFSSDTGGKKAPPFTDHRQGVVETGR